MAIPLVGMAVGAGVSLLFTAVQDLMSTNEPDPAKVQAVKEAQALRERELQAEGLDRMAAYKQAREETSAAMAEAMEVVDSVSGGDYVASALTGAAMGAIPFGAIGKGAAALGRKSGVTSFLERHALTPSSRAMVGKTSDIRNMGAKTDISNMGAKTDITGMGAKTDLRSDITGMGATSSRRAVPVGEGVTSTPFDGASSKLPPLRQADVWPEDPAIAGRLGMGGKTIDTTAERIQPRLGMADEASINPVLDEIIAGFNPQNIPRIGYNRPLRFQPRRSFLMETTGG